MKPQMGVFIIRSLSSNQVYIEAARDLKGVMNGTAFKLKAGGHRNQRLQEAWNEKGAGVFSMEILEILEYHSDDPQNDYIDELALLKMIWEERLTGEGMEVY